MDFERAVFNIVQTCRTKEEIDQAFAQLQLDLERVIADKQAMGSSLLQGFDDRLRDHLEGVAVRAQKALDTRTALLRDFTLTSLTANGASYSEEEPGVYRFSTPSQFRLVSQEPLDPEYRGTFAKDARDTVTYLTKHHPLVKAAMDVHLRVRRGTRTALTLSYTGNHNIHGMEYFVSRTGWWVNFKVMFSGVETEDHILQLGLLSGDESITVNDLLCDNLDRITCVPGKWQAALPSPSPELVEEWLAAQVDVLRAEISDRNGRYYMERRAVIDKYYGSKGDGEVLAEMRHRVGEKQRQVRDLVLQVEAEKSTAKQMELTREGDKLDEELFLLQQRMQTEQMTNFAEKRRALKELEQLAVLKHEVELVSVAQWAMV